MNILILEDNEDRIASFRAAGGALSAEGTVWPNAYRMAAELCDLLAAASLISLDHDLNEPAGTDVGCGMDVVRELTRHKPTCPVLLHTSNVAASWSMLSELQDHGWQVQRVPPVTMGTAWIEKDWLPIVKNSTAV